MARNKYVKDYRLIEHFDEKGRVRTDTEYIGKYHRFAAGSEAFRREKLLQAGICAAGWLLFVGALLLPSQAMHWLFTSLPFAFTALPLGLLTGQTFTFLRLKEPMEHRFADKLDNRYPAVTLAMTGLTGICLVWDLVLWIRGDAMIPGDPVFSGCLSLLFLFSCLAFSRRGKMRTEEE